MFIVWRQRPVKGLGGGPFLVSVGHEGEPWHNLRCGHGGADRIAWTPRVVHTERRDGSPRQLILYYFPTIRSCCIADPFNRAAWWHDVQTNIRYWEESRFDLLTDYIARDRATLLAQLRKVVPPPTAAGRRDLGAFLTRATAERAERDRLDREAFRRAYDQQEQERADQGEAERQARENVWKEQVYEEVLRQLRFPDLDKAFAVLGVPTGTPLDEVKAAYRRLVKVHHPDRNPGNASAAAEFRQVQEAWEMIERDDQGRRAG